MKRLLILVAALLLACSALSCAYRYRRQRIYPVGQREATVPSQDEERVEELESTEKTITGPWHEKSP